MCAADTRIVLVMQRVVRHLIDLDVRPYIGPAPPDERIHFHELEGAVPLDRPGIGSCRRLLTPDPGDPCIVAGQNTPQWLNFPQLAALIWGACPESPTVLLLLLLRRQQRFDLLHLGRL